jgi:hypothetical protein
MLNARARESTAAALAGGADDSLDSMHPGSIEGEAELPDMTVCPQRSTAASWSGGLICQAGIFSVHAKTMRRESLTAF